MGFDHATAFVNSGEMKISLKWEEEDKPPKVTGNLSICGFQLVARPGPTAKKDLAGRSIVALVEVEKECVDDLAKDSKIWLQGFVTGGTSRGGRCPTGIGHIHKFSATLLRHYAKLDKIEDAWDCVATCNSSMDLSLTIQVIVVSSQAWSRSTFLDKNVAETFYRADCKLLLGDEGDQAVYVNKEQLALYSDYFKTLFFGDFKEKDQDTIAIKDINLEDMLEFLWSLQRPPRSLWSAKVETVLHLADRFQCEQIIHEVDEYVMGHHPQYAENFVDSFLMADKYPNIFNQLRSKTRDMVLTSISEYQPPEPNDADGDSYNSDY